MPRRPQCECHEHADHEARGPCHVGIEGKCHWLLGREIRSNGWSGGVVSPYKGLDVCTAYACKKKAGLEVEGSARRGEVPMRAKRPKLATAGAPESEDALLSVKQAFQVVGHRYVDPQRLAMTDPVTLREPLSLERSKSEWLLRGLFKARDRPLDAGKYSFEWVEHGEALAAAWAEGGFVGAVQAYFNSLTAAASAEPEEPEEPEPEPTVPAPAPARAPATSGGGGGDHADLAPDHAELVQQLNAHIKEKGMSLDGKKNSILSQLTPLGHISQSALSIWLGRARNSAGVSDAALGKIDEIARAYLSGASDGEGSGSGGGGGSCGGGGSGGGSGSGGGGGGGGGGGSGGSGGGGGAAARTAAGSNGRRKSSTAGAWRDANELDADSKRILDSYGEIGALRRPLEVMLGAPIGARFTLEASLHANEADSFADGIEQKIRGAQYVPAILQRTGAWAWKVSSSRSPDPVHAVFTDMEGVQDQLFNRFVRAYYRVVDNE